MEPLDTLNPDPQQPSLLKTDYVRQMLSTTAKWTKFLSIIGFIGCGLMVIAGLGLAAIGSSFPSTDNPAMNLIGGSALGVIYILAAALYFFPSRYLYQYAEKLNLAVQSEDETQLILALDKNKSFFKFVGIMTIVVIGLYVLMFIGLIAGVAMGSEFVVPS
ncbi:hypothetical protein Oweho_0218 [Owenweeksia hongkongensis DSM 17368]|uniref:DUF5362 domain-containing protein n=1 Tax=Owenweeksia hongkongensis (strain DSM 17368 / CIP 108786 / JCM 12287 / NRRL B-23963 / UST20020801) TaxID=926562 RepID=G8R7C9_OWEHD|nr:DUF5362 family protein [Owenweeksia hongkongensis]AEV31240.1 hypothetical protein Oweho_0218 [Owenweeksia hongkongensis DSM 17368]